MSGQQIFDGVVCFCVCESRWQVCVLDAAIKIKTLHFIRVYGSKNNPNRTDVFFAGGAVFDDLGK